MIIRLETFTEFFRDAEGLIARHWAEIAQYGDIPLRVDVSRYLAAEAAGMLRTFVARDDAGAVAGYAVFTVSPAMHYAGSLQAHEDVIYVDPRRRGRTIGVRLVRFCDERLRAEGVQVVHHHVKLRHPALGRLLEHEGYESVEALYSKRLDK